MDYIKRIRQKVGHECLITIGSGVIIEKEKSILLEQRSDNGLWGIPGGFVEIGEKVKDAAIREVYEETGLQVFDLDFFGIYSGENYKVKYPNNDEVYSISLIFYTNEIKGELIKSEESKTLKFFKRSEIKLDNINPPHQEFINDWINYSFGPNIN